MDCLVSIADSMIEVSVYFFGDLSKMLAGQKKGHFVCINVLH